MCILHRFPEQKLYQLDTAQEGVLLLRHLGEQKLKVVRWRDTRPHLMARDVAFQPSENDVRTTLSYIPS